eukprot:3695857-Prymnesium_polylepis.1
MILVLVVGQAKLHRVQQSKARCTAEHRGALDGEAPAREGSAASVRAKRPERTGGRDGGDGERQPAQLRHHLQAVHAAYEICGDACRPPWHECRRRVRK